MTMYLRPRFYIFLLILLSLATWPAMAQRTAESGRVFALKDLEELVMLNHPIVKQSALLSEGAQSVVLQSLGKFDPKVEVEFASKQFGNREYYTNWVSDLKVPLWLAGADLKIGFDRNIGDNTNPQYKTGNDGLSGIGLSVPLGQGFFIDARRNTLRQSRIMVRYAEAEQVKQIITVWFDAVRDYWTWYNAYTQYLLIRDGVDLARKRFQAISTQALLGDKPPIDSVEAAITVQDREIQLAKLTVELQNARLLLSNNVWGDNNTPMELPEGVVPQSIDENIAPPAQASLDTLVQLASGQHPELLKLRSKSDQLDVEKSYRQEMLKPKLNLTGSLITSRNTFSDYYPKYYDLNWSNYKVGVDFAFPLFLRAERGKLKEVNIKRREVDYELTQTGREIKNNIFTSYNALQAYRQQLSIQVASIQNQQKLLDAELQKFELGESTLFLINSRETKLIDMKMKRTEIITDFQKKVAELYYKAGTRQNI